MKKDRRKKYADMLDELSRPQMQSLVDKIPVGRKRIGYIRTSMYMTEKTRKKLLILRALFPKRKLYELFEEAVDMLYEKYASDLDIEIKSGKSDLEQKDVSKSEIPDQEPPVKT